MKTPQVDLGTRRFSLDRRTELMSTRESGKVIALFHTRL